MAENGLMTSQIGASAHYHSFSLWQLIQYNTIHISVALKVAYKSEELLGSESCYVL